MNEVPVLILGGGPVGLTASILLSQAGVRSLLVERQPGAAMIPKARLINARTMEVFRQCGVEGAVREAGLAPDLTGMIIWTETLAGREIERRVPYYSRAESAAASPVRHCICTQNILEPVLRRFAEQQHLGELKFSTEAIAFEPDREGIVVTLFDQARGEEHTVRAEYLIAADGARSRVRRQLGVRMLGQENVYDSVSIVFTADLTPWTAHRPAALYLIENERIRGTFAVINAKDRWVFLVAAMAAFDIKAEDLTPQRAAELVRSAVGAPDLAVRILGISPWRASAHVADRYSHGRIFLAGDSAHEMPPTGGFGLNTGVQDVHNLIWKLAAVLRGAAAPTLLETYHDERQPVARAVVEQSLINATSMGRLEQTRKTAGARPAYLNEQGLVFGASYVSSAIVADGSNAAGTSDPITAYKPSARPGGRAPHVFFLRDGAQVSTIDVVGDGFVLLIAGSGRPWTEAACRLADDLSLPLKTEVIDAESFMSAYDLDASGAVLVRPDGYVGWRSRTMTGDPAGALREAISTILGRPN